MIDVEALLASVDIVDVVGKRIDLRRAGSEHEALCPFHDERTPSFTVSQQKQFVHCFGCGFHGNAIRFVMEYERLPFLEACELLGGVDVAKSVRRCAPPRAARKSSREIWVPVIPVPPDAPEIRVGVAIRIYNPKRSDRPESRRWWNLTPSRADEYRDARGRLLGYVLRVDMDDGKIVPQVTWCVGPSGEQRWCLWPFSRPRPICGLDELALRPQAPVLVVEGEKCREAGRAALPMYVVICWPGGTKGMRHVDWSPLSGRDVVLWPDADKGGRDAMLGYIDPAGVLVEGVAQRAYREGARSLRLVDTACQPKGWDIHDALHADGWSPRQLATWARSRVVALDIAVDPGRKAV